MRNILLAALRALLCVPCLAIAQTLSYPTQPVRILVGGAAGSVPDALARPIGERLAQALGQPVIVENRPGAAGIIAMEALMRSAPDGHTLAIATMSQAVFNSFLFAKLPYDPLRDLQPVALLATGAMVVAAHPSFPAHTFADFVARAKENPGKLFVGMPQKGAPPHVVALWLNRAAGIDVSMVPHKSGAEAVAAAVGGQIPLVIDAPTIIAPQVKAGRLKALVVTGRAREPELPDVATVAESGLSGIEGEAWIGLVAPAGTRPEIVQRLNRELSAILESPATKQLLAALAFRVVTATPERFGQVIGEAHAKWGPLIRDAGLKID